MTDKHRRRIFLGPHHLSAIETLDEVLNLPVLTKECKLPKMDFVGIFFSTMIQCGVEEFVLISPNVLSKRYCLNSDFLSNRITFDSDLTNKYYRIYDKILPLFKEYCENENLEKENKSQLNTTQMFLTDLLFGMKTNLSSTTTFVSPYPDLTKLKSMLAPELYYPIRNLIMSIEEDDLKLPLPSKSILHDNIQKYEEIIDSNIFSNYAISHQNLQNNSISKSKTITQICKDAKILRTQFACYIDLKRLAINSLNVIPSGVELFGGKIYGTVAEGLFKLFEPTFKDYISNNRRLVTYQFAPIAHDVVSERIFEHIKKENENNKINLHSIFEEQFNKLRTPP
jgi:hypothetical protein